MKKQYGRIGIFSGMFIFIFFVSFFIWPVYQRTEHQIVIEANGIVNDASLADGVQIQSIYLDGKEQDLTDFFQANTWNYENGMFTWNSFCTNQNRIEAAAVFRQAEIYFLENSYCGGMTCYIDGREYASRDLYAPETGSFRLVVNGEKNPNSFGRLFFSIVAAAGLFLVFSYAGNRMHLPRDRMILCRYFQKIGRTFDILNAAVCMLLLFTVIYNFSAVVEKSRFYETLTHDIDTTEQMLFTKTGSVIQEIDLDAKTTEITLYFQKEKLFQGSIDVAVIQDQKEICEKHVYAGSIQDDFTYTFQTPALKKGTYTIVISGPDQENGRVSLLLSRQKMFANAQIDGNTYDGNVAVTLQTSITPTAHAYRIILFAVLLLTAGTALWNTLRQSRSSSVYYICAVLLTAMTIGIQFPCLSITPEFFGESGSNFYQMTYQLEWKEHILLDDAGYWPLFQRLIADFIIYVLRQGKYAVYLMQGCAVLFVSFAFARFCLHFYQSYAQERARFAVSLFGGVSYVVVYGEECLAFHNFAYYGIVLLLLNLLLDFGQLTKKQFLFLTTEGALLCLSKGRYGVFFPLYAMLLALFLIRQIWCRNRQRAACKSEFRQMIYLSVTGVGAFLQTVYMLNHISVWNTDTKGAGQVISSSIYYCVQAFITVWIPYSDITWNAPVMNSFFIILLTGACMFTVYKWKERKKICGHMAVIATFLMGSSMMNAIMQNEYKNYTWSKVSPLPLNRANIFMITGILFLLFFLCSLIRKKAVREWVFSILLLVLSVRFLASRGIYNNDNCFIQANWNNDYQVIDQESYIIPIWYQERFITKNAEVMYLGSREEEELETSQWNYTTGPTIIKTMDFPYKTTSVFQTNVLKERSVNSIYAKKAAVGMNGNVTVILYDENDQILCREKAKPTDQRLYLSYVFDQPVGGVARMEFVDDTGRSVHVQTDLFLGICVDKEK